MHDTEQWHAYLTRRSVDCRFVKNIPNEMSFLHLIQTTRLVSERRHNKYTKYHVTVALQQIRTQAPHGMTWLQSHWSFSNLNIDSIIKDCLVEHLITQMWLCRRNSAHHLIDVAARNHETLIDSLSIMLQDLVLFIDSNNTWLQAISASSSMNDIHSNQINTFNARRDNSDKRVVPTENSSLEQRCNKRFCTILDNH